MIGPPARLRPSMPLRDLSDTLDTLHQAKGALADTTDMVRSYSEEHWYTYRYFYVVGSLYTFLILFVLLAWFLVCMVSRTSRTLTSLLFWSVVGLAALGGVLLIVGVIIA